MHHKFCVVDLKKVIHGSYNWTKKAQYNNAGTRCQNLKLDIDNLEKKANEAIQQIKEKQYLQELKNRIAINK